MWCCPSFEAHYTNVGRRGFSVCLVPNQKQARFLIQSRLVEEGLEGGVTSVAPISLVVETGISFCPGSVPKAVETGAPL